jgi:hypothetical protein
MVVASLSICNYKTQRPEKPKIIKSGLRLLSVCQLINQEMKGMVMNYSQTHHGEKHYCDNFHCPQPQKLTCNQFCISCNRTVGPHRTTQLKSEFVQVTQKELALQESLPPRLKLNLTYGYLPGVRFVG